MSVETWRGKFFLDTNILVYSFDAQAPTKQETARQIISSALQSQRGLISSQVVQEFLNVAQQKFSRPMNSSEARLYLNTVLRPLCHHFPSLPFYELALHLREETGYSFYDSLIVAAAVETESNYLISEDLQGGQTIRGVQIVNPFA